MEYSPSPVVLSPVSKPKNMAATPAAPSETWTGKYAPSRLCEPGAHSHRCLWLLHSLKTNH